jgi:GT2 family glycosyltransferase
MTSAHTADRRDHSETPRRLKTWAIVLNFNGAELTSSCVSLLDPCEDLDRVLVVENGSRPDERDRLAEALAGWSHVRTEVLQLGTNYGYGGGMQAGIDHAIGRGADLIFLVNNDCSASPEAVRALVSAMGDDSSLGACGVPVKHPTWTDGGSQFGHFRLRKNVRYPVRPGTYDVEFPPGDAWMLRVDAIREVGGLDCRLFLIGEEPDWCFRARLHGWNVRIVGDASVSAEVSATASRYAGEVIFYAARNLLWLTRRQLSQPARVVALAAYVGLWLPRSVFGRIANRDWAGLRFLLEGSRDGLFRDCRWSDRIDDGLPSRVGRLRTVDADSLAE